MKINILKSGGFKTKNNYYHVPLLYLAYGRDGFIFVLLTIKFLIRWGNAAKDPNKQADHV